MTTPYRTDLDALREKKSTLETELGGLRSRAAEVATELASVDERLKAAEARRRRLPTLDQIRVASPCSARWDEMLGDERVRFCTSCEKSVFNLSAMPREDAERLLAERLGDDLCVRFHQRADGTILTQDCPVGASKKRRKQAVLAAAGAGALALAATQLFTRMTMGKPCPTAVMGEPAVMGSIAAPVDDRPTTVPPVHPETQTPHVQQAPPPRPTPRMGRMVLRK